MIGVTALIYLAKGLPIGQLLSIMNEMPTRGEHNPFNRLASKYPREHSQFFGDDYVVCPVCHTELGEEEWNENTDDNADKKTQTVGVESFADEFREGRRPQRNAHGPGSSAEPDKGDENAESDVHKDQPEQPHAELSGNAAKAHQRRSADKGGTVAHSHDKRMSFSAGDKIVFVALGLAESTKTEITDKEGINENESPEDPGIHS